MKAFCVVIMKPLVLSCCPLPSGTCTWQHRQTNHCKYSETIDSVEAHAASIGAIAPTPGQANALEQKLVEAVRSEIQES